MKIKYFAWMKRTVGVAEEDVTPPASVATVGDLVTWLRGKSAGHASSGVDARKSARRPRAGRRFTGQLSWQSSHPKSHSPMAGRRCMGMRPRFSIVWKLTQVRASRMPGATKAPVGHESMQRVHAPHDLARGASGSISRSVRMVASRV